MMSYKITDRTFKSLSGIEVLPRDKLLLAYLSWRSDEKGRCWPAINTIAEDLGLSVPTVVRSLRALKKAGALKIEKKSQYGRITNKYFIPPRSPVITHPDQGRSPTLINGDHPPRSTVIKKQVIEQVNEQIIEHTGFAGEDQPTSNPEETPEEKEMKKELKGQSVENLTNHFKGKQEILITTDPYDYASEVVNSQANLTGVGLGKLWGFLLLTNGYVKTIPTPSKKQMSQLNNIKTKCQGSDQAAAQVMIECVQDWKGFLAMVKKQNKLPDQPPHPQIWYLLLHVDIGWHFVLEKGNAPEEDQGYLATLLEKQDKKDWFLEE